MTLPLNLSQRLKAAGFPQDQFPQMVYAKQVLTWRNIPYYYYYRPLEGNFPGFADWCAAPDAFTVMDWFERERGWRYWRTSEGNWIAAPRLIDLVHADTPEALITAILDTLELTSKE